MLNSAHFDIIAGLDVVEAIRAERARTVAAGSRPGTFDSETLCRHQERIASRGVLGAEIVKSNYGYSVRYDSGLQNWGLLASSRAGTVDGSLEAAIAWAKTWQAEDPTRRYVSMVRGA